jgi:coenzyme F420-reducing hydrogenase alpha subunit
MSVLAGHLRITLTWSNQRWLVAIRSARPLTTSRVFLGKGVAEVARQIPLLYSLCATAQSQAFTTAAEAIAGCTPTATILHHRRQLLRAELIKEHLWRLLLDWPPLLGLPRADATMAHAMQAWQLYRASLRASVDLWQPGARQPEHTPPASEQPLARLIAIAEQASLAMPAPDWLATQESLASWQRWITDSQAPAAGLARALQEQALVQLGHADGALLRAPALASLEASLSGTAAEAFIATPTLNGLPQETTPVARMADTPLITALTNAQGRGLMTRLAALLLELAHTLADLRSGAPDERLVQGFLPDARTALTAIAAARGLLVHRLRLTDGRIAQHQVLAPTEWNFHPQGILSRALTGLPPANTIKQDAELKRLSRLIVTAIDPCVDYHIDLRRAP